MPKRKGRSKEARVNTPVDELNGKDTIAHYNAVLLEEQNARFQLVMERMEALSAQVDQRFEAFSAQVDQRFDAFEKKTDRRFSILEQAVRGLKDDMIDMERRICSKINRITERCDNHEYRIEALEATR